MNAASRWHKALGWRGSLASAPPNWRISTIACGEPEPGPATASRASTASPASALWISAKVALDRGDLATAAERARAAVAVHRGGDVTSTLTGIHLMAGILDAAGRHREAATLLGGCDAICDQIGFFPERMDPADAPRVVAGLRERLSGPEFAEAYAAGRGLGLADVIEKIGASEPVRR
ncbi:hypothetical protein [Amycolatopsis pigmentata]|uniref:MalT-like TPR region domain-containing protein n=1 Tax=Amycolatopsis pigmentata TaxID=450801 RepID=A0ABW5FXZ6_9PSEU